MGVIEWSHFYLLPIDQGSVVERVILVRTILRWGLILEVRETPVPNASLGLPHPPKNVHSACYLAIQDHQFRGWVQSSFALPFFRHTMDQAAISTLFIQTANKGRLNSFYCALGKRPFFPYQAFQTILDCRWTVLNLASDTLNVQSTLIVVRI